MIRCERSFVYVHSSHMIKTMEKTCCITCKKDKVAYKCNGCLQDFCFNHLNEHREQFGKQLEELENQRNFLRQIHLEEKTYSQKHVSFQQVNQWEQQSILKIKQTANKARESLMEYIDEYIEDIEMKLSKLTKEIKETRDENDFNEIILSELKEKLNELEDDFNLSSNIIIRRNSSS